MMKFTDHQPQVCLLFLYITIYSNTLKFTQYKAKFNEIYENVWIKLSIIFI